MKQPTTEVTLAQILQAREDRVRLQQSYLQTYHCPVISFTMNIAGPVKTSPLIQRGFREGLRLLSEKLPANAIQMYREDILVTGCQAMYAVYRNAGELKKICLSIEDSSPLGRLFDMDVLDADGVKLERNNPRNCIVCGAAGRVCAAGRKHTISQLQAATTKIFEEYFAQKDTEHIASLAVQSLIDEVQTTPKPGLVDRRNCGSHRDMDIRHFIASANSLRPYFEECVKIGQDTASRLPQETFSLLRKAGILAEQAMLRATGGVNTHKGIIYTLGILCGSIGRLWQPEVPVADIAAITEECSNMVRSSLDADFSSGDTSTAGLQLYRSHGITGIRGEVAAGLPSVMNIGLPAYMDALQSGLSPNDAGAVTLLHLISQVEDTNLHHRGGISGAQWAAKAAQALLQTTTYPSASMIEQLDDAFIDRNLSPGGCADLLAVTYFLHSCKRDFLPKHLKTNH